jgi:tripartite-type tricarboxylate transporter receptor subunit TctC
MMLKTFTVAAAAASLFFSASAWAAWPDDKPIEVVIGFAAGGGTDVMARKLLPVVAKKLGGKANFVVINRPGAAGELALGSVARAKPDGYTLAVVNMPSFYFLPLTKKTQYQTDDFQLIARVVDDPTVVAVRDDSRFTNLQSLVAASKQKPASVSAGHNGTGTNGDLAIGLLSKAAGIELNPIAYRGSAAQKTDVLGGHLDLALVSAGELPELHDGGKGLYRILGQLTPKRSAALPQVPTATEAGLKVVMSSERGFAAPRGTPADIMKKLESAVAEALKDPEFLSSSSDDKVISYASGKDWLRDMEESRKELQPLAGTRQTN